MLKLVLLHVFVNSVLLGYLSTAVSAHSTNTIFTNQRHSPPSYAIISLRNTL